MKIINNDGIITIDDGQILGDAVPDFYGGINNNFTYKNFSLNLLFDYSVGNEIYDLAGNGADIGVLHTGFTSNVYGIYRNRWTPENINSNIPRAGSNFKFLNEFREIGTDFMISDGSYLRLKTLNFQYLIPLKNNELIKGLSAYIIGTHLLTYTGYEGFTPDVNSEGTSVTHRGFDNNIYPQSRSFTLGIRANF